MSYNIGQFRFQNFTQIDNTPATENNQYFTIIGTNENLLPNNFTYTASVNFNNTDNYFLSCRIPKNALDTTVIIKLNKTGTNSQIIKQFTMPAKMSSQSQYYVIDIPIKANDNYTQLQWVLDDATDGSVLNYTVYKLKHLLPINQNEIIKKIGIQGPPLLPCWINGECIRLNSKGIYELNNNLIDIYSVKVLPRYGINDYFFIDYESQESQEATV